MKVTSCDVCERTTRNLPGSAWYQLYLSSKFWDICSDKCLKTFSETLSGPGIPMPHTIRQEISGLLERLP